MTSSDQLAKLLELQLKEQRAARRWKIFFRLIWLAIIVTLLVWILFAEDKTSSNEPHVAIVELKGVIGLGDDTYKDFSKELEEAMKDKATLGVIVRANSPGGSAVYAGMLYDEIKRLKQEYPNKPIDFVVEEVCASGCYYAASAADGIYANQASIVGSIGVIYTNFDLTGLMSKLGVESRLQVAGSNKAIGYPFAAQTPEQQKIIQQSLDEIHLQFIQAVKEGRGSKLKDQNGELFSGRYWIGQDAFKLGLIDGFASVKTLALEKFKTDNLREYSKSKFSLGSLLKGLNLQLPSSLLQSSSFQLLP